MSIANPIFTARKLANVVGDIVVMGSYEYHNLSFPSLVNVSGGMLLDGHFDQYVFLHGGMMSSHFH